MVSLAVLLTGLCAACGSLGFDVAQDLPEQRIAGSPLGGILPSFLQAPIPLNIDLRAETERRSTGPATAAFMKSMTLTITPAGMPAGNFDFLDEVEIYVAQRGGGSLPRRLVATVKPVPKGQTTLTFTILPGVDLLPYVSAGAEISATASGRQPPQDVTFTGRVELSIRI